MEVMMRPSYSAALEQLGSEKIKIKNFLKKLERDHTTKGLHIEKLENGFVSIKANNEIRVIGQWRGDTLVLHYIDHHDSAYAWAEKRKLLSKYVGGGYKFAVDDTEEDTTSTETINFLPQSKSDYGKLVFENLVRLGFPTPVARNFETTQNEDELFERLEQLQENLQEAVLSAILDDIPYEIRKSKETTETSRDTQETEAKPAIKAVEAPKRIETGSQGLEKIIDEANPPESPVVVSIKEPSPMSKGDLRVDRVKEGCWWLLKIFDGDTWIGNYEKSYKESGAKEKEVEILFDDNKRPKEERESLRRCAADALRKAYQANGEKPFIVEWVGKAVDENDGKQGVKQIKTEKNGEILGQMPRKCHRPRK